MTITQNIMTTLIVVVITCFFLVIYYLNSDVYILENGQKTEGTITSVQSRSQTDSYGRTHVKYIVSYQFQDSRGQTQRGKITIDSSTCRLKELDRIEVSYFPNKPHKNTIPHSCR